MELRRIKTNRAHLLLVHFAKMIVAKIPIIIAIMITIYTYQTKKAIGEK